jgi:hypothetical protein
LPDSLSGSDLKAVAKTFIPDADVRSIEALVSYAQMSAKYLAGIEAAASRARFISRKAGREKVEFKDVMRAIDESVIPSDTAFAAAMSAPAKSPRRRAVSVPARPLQRDFSRVESALPTRGIRPALVASEALARDAVAA